MTFRLELVVEEGSHGVMAVEVALGAWIEASHPILILDDALTQAKLK